MRALPGLVLVLAALLPAATGAYAEEGAAERRLRDLAGELGQREPLLRVGLGEDHRIALTSARPFRILDPRTGQAVFHAAFQGEVQVIAEGGPAGEVESVFRIQVGAFQTEAAARDALSELEHRTGAAGVVHHDPDRGVWRVRLGEERDRLALSPLMEQLRESGAEGMWIAEEAASAAAAVALRLVDASWESFVVPGARLAVVPESGATLSVAGKPYRGLIELRVSPSGRVRPIDWIELEQYLLGVVPAELGPEVWPQLEALKAQAVAARTYAWRNRGQFEEEGFDICATPRCQVYEGAGAEHPLSDRAVSATRGEILVWHDEPIDALYTATCGGHTEDGRGVFPENDEPYLVGVPCRAESEALATLRGTLSGRAIVPVIDETGADVTRDWALLSSANVIDPEGTSGPRAAQPATGAELRAWTAALAARSGRPRPAGPVQEPATLALAATALLADLGWEDRADILLTPEDLPALLRDPETEALAPRERRALAYLAAVEALEPFPDGRLHAERAPSRARLLPALVRIGDSYDAFALGSGVVAQVGAESLRVVRGKEEQRLPLGAGMYLVGRVGGRPAAVPKLELWPGDRVRFRTDAQGRLAYCELEPPVKGASDDRSAKLYSWEERKTRRELEVAIHRRLPVGRLQNLEVQSRGVSGRILALKVVGSEGSHVVRGFDVRQLLDLRESLTVIEIQRDARGEIESVVFAGKGWGHGVGMCQVGAYGMALRGKSYREILQHYYTGPTLQRIRPDTP